MVDYPSPGIKKAGIAAIGQFCCSLAKVTQNAQSEEGLAALHELLSRCLPKLFETIEEDQDRHVVMTTLETLKDMVAVIQAPLLDNGVLDRIIKCLLKGHMVADYACGIDFSQDITYLISGDEDGKLFIRDWKTSRLYSNFKFASRQFGIPMKHQKPQLLAGMESSNFGTRKARVETDHFSSRPPPFSFSTPFIFPLTCFLLVE